MRLIVIAMMISFGTTMNALAFGVSVGGGCGDCGFSGEKADSARLLQRQVQDADKADLRLLLLVGEICSSGKFDCGAVSEEEAQRLVTYHFDATRSWWDKFQKVSLGAVAFVGLWLGVMNRYRPRTA